MKKKTALRGQTIVLFSLTVLAIALMVLITLSLGAKVRDRMDLQTTADAASYSDAIVTARTMNGMAVMNRAMIAHVVSTIGTVSLISYATKFYQDAITARTIYIIQLAIIIAGAIVWTIVCAICWGSCTACFWAVACWRSIASPLPAIILLTVLINRIGRWLGRDQQLYRAETAPRFLAATALFNQSRTAFDVTLRDKLTNPTSQHATSYLTRAKVVNGSSVAAASSPINLKEMSTAALPNIDHIGEQPYHAGMIAMGTRGNKFVPYHKPDWFTWSWGLTFPWSLPNVTTIDANAVGRGYLNQSWTPDPNSSTIYGHPFGTYAHDGQDHVRTWLIGLTLAGITAGLSSNIVSCNTFGPIAEIVGIIGLPTSEVRVGPTQHDVYGSHGPHSNVPQVFPSFYEITPRSLTDTDDLNGQPRLLNVVAKDLSGPSADPWDVRGGTRSAPSNLNFHFTSAGSTFDMVTEPATHTGGKQLAVGAGVAYYSRPDHYPEPPNLFNPFWHATLGRPTIDRPLAASANRVQYDNDMKAMLTTAGQTEAATAYDALTAAGYRGLE